MICPQQNRNTCQFPKQRDRHAPVLLQDDCYLSYRALYKPGSCLLHATACLNTSKNMLSICSERPSVSSSDHATAWKHRNGLETMTWLSTV
jgi:hypothetical protein